MLDTVVHQRWRFQHTEGVRKGTRHPRLWGARLYDDSRCDPTGDRPTLSTVQLA